MPYHYKANIVHRIILLFPCQPFHDIKQLLLTTQDAPENITIINSLLFFELEICSWEFSQNSIRTSQKLMC